jgi:hypothetical protein
MSQRVFQYVITIQGKSSVPDDEPRIGTYARKATFDEGVDRQQAFEMILKKSCEELRTDPTKTFVLFWSFEPNDL